MKGPKNGKIKIKSKYNKSFTRKEKQGIYLVSVGKKYHEGEFLLAALEFMGEHFELYTIVVADTLQRHNYDNVNTKEINYQLAYNEGTLWLERNKKAISSFNNILVSRWDVWLEHKMYPETRAKIDTLYNDSEEFRKTFRDTAISFLRKKKRIITNEDIEHSIEYLKEECSIIIPIWSAEKINKIVYPGELTQALKAVYEEYEQTTYSNYAEWFPISFKRYSTVECL